MNVVIIGAGQTGRGFVAPFFYKNDDKITFIDKDENLIEQLNSQKYYLVKYFDNQQSFLKIEDYKALYLYDNKSINAISNADIVTTSVYANQIENLISLFEKAQEKRVLEEKLKIVCIENGIDVKKPLIDANIDAEITEGIIYCTSVNEKKSLNIINEANITLPIDKTPLRKHFNIDGLELISNFKETIERKIYTYNFISAVIAYLGSYKQYQQLSEAASDKYISKFLKEILVTHNKVIADYFNIRLTEQDEFSQQAIKKFFNSQIEDSIERNATQAKRKLGVNERLLFPLKLAINSGEHIDKYLQIISAAIYYAVDIEDNDLNEIMPKFDGFEESANVKRRITKHLNGFQQQLSLNQILV